MSKGNKKNTENGGKRMNDITVTNGISGKNKERVIEWTNSRGADFLAQWAGPKLAFPLTQEQLEQMENLYSVFHDGAFIGMIQKIKTENSDFKNIEDTLIREAIVIDAYSQVIYEKEYI